MSLHKKKAEIPVSLLFLVSLVIATIVLLVLYGLGLVSAHWAPIVGGMAVSALVSSIHFWFNYSNYRKSEKLEDNGVIEFLDTRGDKEYYSGLINRATVDFKLIFHTSKRFFEDFCEDYDEDNLMVKRLDENENLNVKMLLLHRDCIEQKDQEAFTISQRFVSRMKNKYGDRFQVKYYQHTPTHNLFITDKDAVIGPYFPEERSKYLSSIHFAVHANFIQQYIRHFNREWDNGTVEG